jgi:hypothetical protein
MNDVKVGDRVIVLGAPYSGQHGVVEFVNPGGKRAAWPLWVNLDEASHAVGFSEHEVLPEAKA